MRRSGHGLVLLLVALLLPVTHSPGLLQVGLEPLVAVPAQRRALRWGMAPADARGRLPSFVGERGPAFDADGALGVVPEVVRPCLAAYRLLALLGVSRWADDGAGLLLAAVTQVRMGVFRGAPVRRLCRLPPFVGELRPAVGAHRTARLTLGCLLRGLLLRRALHLCLVLLLSTRGLFPGAGVGGLAAGVADRLPQGLHVVTAEAEEHRSGRTVLSEVLQPGRDDRDLPVVEVVAAGQPLPLPQVTGQLHQARDGAVGVALADAVEHQQHGRVRRIAVPALGDRPAPTPHRALLAIGVLHRPLEEPRVLL